MPKRRETEYGSTECRAKFALFSMDLLGKKSQLPAAELSDDEMDALSGLTKINPTGKQGSFNPYKTINPEFLTTALEQDDDDWMYMGEDNKPRERTGHIFNMVGSGGLVVLLPLFQIAEIGPQKPAHLPSLHHLVGHFWTSRFRLIPNLARHSVEPYSASLLFGIKI
jgi:hypothetical protein